MTVCATVEERPFQGRVTNEARRASAPVVALGLARGISPYKKPPDAALKRRSSTVPDTSREHRASLDRAPRVTSVPCGKGRAPVLSPPPAWFRKRRYSALLPLARGSSSRHPSPHD